MVAERAKVGPGRYRAAGLPPRKPPSQKQSGTKKIGRLPLAQVAVPCVHLGEKLPGQPCGSDLYKCNYDGVVCSKIRPCRDAVRTCTDCDHRRVAAPAEDFVPRYDAAKVPPGGFRWVRTADLAADSIALAGMLPPNCSAVAGIPRSGMLPASIIATHLQLPLYQLTEEGELEKLGHGSRGRNLGFHTGGGPIAVVDDTVYGGAAMRRARKALAGRNAVFAAVYARPQSAGNADLYAKELHSPHLLEWNVMNNGPLVGKAANPVYGAGLATDLDGVILHDRESGGRAGSPYLVPRSNPVPLIVTGRHERHRAATESLLRSVGTKWAKLVMLPDDVPQEPDAIAAFKARHFAESKCGFFVESDEYQAAVIARLSGKPVCHPLSGQVFTSSNDAGRLAELERTDRMYSVPHVETAPTAECNRTAGLLEFVREIAAVGKLDRVGEVGSYRGASTEVWAVHAREVVAVDGWDAEWPFGRQITRSADVEAEFDKVAARHPHVKKVKARSPGPAKNYPDGHFDAVYIDGAHDYESVLADILAWTPKVKRGGWISGHDYSAIFPGVVDAVRDSLGFPHRVFRDSTWAVRVLPTPAVGPIVFPTPLPVRVPSPKSDKVIVTICVGTGGEELRAISEPLIRRYAERVGADYLCVEGGGFPGYTHSAKFRVGSVARHYRQTLYLDLDVTFDPERLPDLFSLAAPDEFAAVLDGQGAEAVFGESYRRLCESQGRPGEFPASYFNSGVMLFGSADADLFSPPPAPVWPDDGAWRGDFIPVDQNWLNARVVESGVRFRELPRWANWLGEVGPAQGEVVLRHWAGIPDKLEKMRAAEEWAGQ